MAQFYQIEWVSPPSDTPDQHGNHWYTVKIADRNIRTLAKNPPEVGQVYGEITEETSQAGKQYYRLRRKQIPDGVTPPATASPGGVAGVASQSSEILKLLQDNNRILKLLIGENEPEERGDDSGKDEVVLDDIDENEPVDLSEIPF